MNNNIYLQVFILLLGLPTLGYVIYKIQSDERQRLSLLVKLEENNRRYIFNQGTEVVVTNPEHVIGNSIVNLQQASEFIENISEGKYTAQWTGLSEANQELNKTSLAGRLTNMRAQLEQMKREEERRFRHKEADANEAPGQRQVVRRRGPRLPWNRLFQEVGNGSTAR